MSKITTQIERLHKPRAGKHWAKHVTRIDPSKSNGYAFVGEWVRMGGTVEIPLGAVILAVDEDESSRGRMRGRTVRVFQATERGLAEFMNEYMTDPGWALHARATIETMLPDAGERQFKLVLTEKQRGLVILALEGMYAGDPLSERENEATLAAVRAAEEVN